MKRKNPLDIPLVTNTSPNKRLKTDHSTSLPIQSYLLLPPEQQNKFIEEKKKRLDEYWNHYLLAKDKKDYVNAIYYYAETLKDGYSKAIELYSLNSTASYSSFSIEEEIEPFYVGLGYHLGLGFPQDYQESMYWYTIAAKEGHAFAQNNLGYSYMHGLGVTKDLKQAFFWFQKATKQEFALAQYNFAEYYYKGEGIIKDLKQAFFWYQKAAEQGIAIAQRSLANCYYGGQGVVKDLDQAFSWYQKAAEQGDAIAQCSLAACYYGGQGVVKDLEQVFFWLQKAAEQGDTRAQYTLARCYYAGQGVVKDLEQAFSWFQKAAEQGDARAQYTLARCYHEGQGVVKDLEQAFSWFQKAAEQGDAIAQCSLANCYFKGYGVTQDLKQVFFWYQKAAEQGDAIAQCSLANCYFKGYGVTQDLKQVFSWYQKAAEQGYAIAQYSLAACYHAGQGVVKDLDQAFSWFQKAAEQGYAIAQDGLAACYYYGHGVTQDLDQACFWYQKAAEQGHAKALKSLKNMNTPLANYTVAWIYHEQTQLIHFILTNEQVCRVFLKNDLIKMVDYYKNEMALQEFINALLKQANDLHIEHSSFLIKCLVTLDTQLRSKGIDRDEIQSLFLTLLVNHIDYSRVTQDCIEPLMSFFCNHYYEGSYSQTQSRPFVDALIKLWYKAHTFDVLVLDTHFNKLLAYMLLPYCYKGEHRMTWGDAVNSNVLGLLIAAYENNSFLSTQEEQCLSRQIMFQGTHYNLAVQSLLSRLNQCIIQFNASCESGWSFFSLMQKSLEGLGSLPLNEYSYIQLFDKLCYDANLTLQASARLGFLVTPLRNEEKKLAMLLQKKDTQHLLQWIEEVEYNREENKNTAK